MATLRRAVSPDEAVALVESGQTVFVHGGAATPTLLLDALAERRRELRRVRTVHLHLEGDVAIARPECADAFEPHALFIGASMRQAVAEGRAQYVPVFLSEAPGLFRRGLWPLDAAIVQVSPPDAHGWCSLGVSVDVAKAAVETARRVIALVNPSMPHSHGDGFVHAGRFDAVVETDVPIVETAAPPPDAVEQAIGRNVAALVEDGATLQMGIGGIPDAAVRHLGDRRDLGVHTEMFSDGLLALVETGVVTGARKRSHPGKIVSSFAMGSRRLYDFIDDNPSVAMLDAAYTNDTHVIRRNPRVTAINGAVEIDLTGQVCADSIGARLLSGVGGQMDFVRGATLSEGGKAIFALASKTPRGESKIVPMLRPGAGVVTTRAHVQYVVTEHGVASLYGKSLAERARALAAIADPSHREALEREARARFGRRDG